MRYKAIAVVLFALALTSVHLGDAQQPKKAPRIGFLSPISEDSRVEAFRERLRELGYVEGQNITIEYRWADGRFERLPDLAMELVRLNVDVVVASHHKSHFSLALLA